MNVLARLSCLFLAAVVGCSQPTATEGVKPMDAQPRGSKAFAGVYVQDSADSGAGYRLEVRKDGKWAMANLSSGFWGTWREKDGKVSLTITDGSSGRLSAPMPMAVQFEGNDEVRLGEEWGLGIFRRQPPNAPYMISFSDTSLQ